MPRKIPPIVLLFLLHAGAVEALTTPPTFIMDLSAPPAERWSGAVAKVLERHPFDTSFGPAFAAHNTSMFDKLKPAQWMMIGDSVKKHFPEQAAELESLSTQFTATGNYVSYEYLAGWVYFHELAHTDLQDSSALGDISTSCSAIVAKVADGSMIFGGNMDQSPESVRNVTLHITFVHNGETWMEGIDWYWFTTGVTRLVRKGVASLQENWRTTITYPAADVLAQIEQGVMPQVFAFRSALTADLRSDASAVPTYGSILSELISVPLASPFYVIITGVAEDDGAIIARNTTGAAETLHLKDSADGWFIAQTNYDHSKVDSETDPRRTAAEVTLRQMDQSVGASELGLFAALSTYPVHNPHTAYTVVVHPASGSFKCFVRQAMCPENPGQSVVTDTRYCAGKQ